MKLHTELAIQQRLAAEPVWAQSPVGRLARLSLDHDIPLDALARYLGVARVVLRRWVYLRVGGTGPLFNPGGGRQRRELLNARILRLCRVIEAARWQGMLHAPWHTNLLKIDSKLPA